MKHSEKSNNPSSTDSRKSETFLSTCKLNEGKKGTSCDCELVENGLGTLLNAINHRNSFSLSLCVCVCVAMKTYKTSLYFLA